MDRKELELAIAMGSATLEDFEGFEPEEVIEMKHALPYQERVIPAAVFKAPTPEQIAAKTLSMIFNVQVPDRMGDLLLSNPADAKKYGGKGWETDRFLHAGGPYLHGHDHAFTVGKVLELRIEKVSMPNDRASTDKAQHNPKKPHKSFHALTGDVQFLDSEVLPFSQGDFLLTLEGLTASSVGYIPKVRTYIDDEKEREKLGLGIFGSVQSTMELLEISKVAVPANQWSAGSKAIDDLVAKGLMEESLASDYKRIRIEEPATRVHQRLKVMVAGTELQLECVDGVCMTCDTKDIATPEQLEEARQEDEACFDALEEGLGLLGVKEVTELPDAIRALKSMSPNERGLLRLQGIFDMSSELCQQVQEILDELGDDGDLSRLSLATSTIAGQNISVSVLTECLKDLLAGSPEALTRLASGDASGDPVVDSESTPNGESTPGGDGSGAENRAAETALAFAARLDEIGGRFG